MRVCPHFTVGACGAWCVVQARKAEWDEEMKLNAQWKAVLDKQEADRTGQYERLRERIKKMQKTYEDNAGAEDERRLQEEEERRERHIKEESARFEEAHRQKQLARKEQIENTTASLFDQMEGREVLRKKTRAEDEVYAATVKADYLKQEERDAQAKALKKGRAKQQYHCACPWGRMPTHSPPGDAVLCPVVRAAWLTPYA